MCIRALLRHFNGGDPVEEYKGFFDGKAHLTDGETGMTFGTLKK